jgi:predicted GNAT family N-acyltransferase
MATDEARRGTGIGAGLLAAVLDHVADHDGELVWCNARTPASRFYERAGFAVHGDEWVDPEIGPHVAMWRDIRP